MIFSLSTRWNASRHKSGEELIAEILTLGINHVELSYDLTLDLAPGVRKMVNQKAVFVTSVHAFCPVPVGVSFGHPELFRLTDANPRLRAHAVSNIIKTADFTKEMGAQTVILHGGTIRMRNLTRRLVELYQAGKQFSPQYDKVKMKLIIQREKKVIKQLQYLYDGIEQLLPALDKMDIKLAIENLPYWESIPSELELNNLISHFDSPNIRYWHDAGHAQVKQNLGFINQTRWLEKLAPFLAGMHVHDVIKPAFDHIMPPNGAMDFGILAPYAKYDIPAVLEPMPGIPAEDIKTAVQLLAETWKLRDIP